MLSNNDFAQLLKSGDVAGGGGKVRFDLKQVSDWDKQNAAVFKKKKHSGGKTPGRQNNNNDDTDDIATQRNANAYRDRALERRKEVNSAEDAALEAVVAKLDAEQTKFLGGDLEHTHLVKGLDYALLRKIRGSATESGGGDGNKEAGVPESSRESQTETTVRRDVPVQTLMGHNIKDLLTKLSRSQGAMERSSKASDKASSSVASMFARLAFDFDVNPETEVDLPTSITRSKQEWTGDDDSDSTMTYILPKTIHEKLKDAISRASTKKRKRKEETSANDVYSIMAIKSMAAGADKSSSALLSRSQASGVGGAVAAKVPTPIVDNFDIFEDVGKYVPVGALVEDNSQSVSVSAVPPPQVIAAGAAVTEKADASSATVKDKSSSDTLQSVKGLFSNLLAAQTDADKGKGQGRGQDEAADLMAPVRAALRAEAEREKAKIARTEAKASGSAVDAPMSLAAAAKEGNVIHRDVFGTGDAAVKKGDAMWHGTYDIYPENGDYEVFDSDDEAGDGDGDGGGASEGGGKSKKKKSSGGASGNGNSSSSSAPSGTNRAARRAAASAASAGK